MADLRGRMFERQGDHLVPADLHALEFVQELPEGKRVLIDHRTPRSPENHAHFFAILRVVCENKDGYPDEETLLDSLKIAVGHTRTVIRMRAPEGEEEKLAADIEEYMETSAPSGGALIFHEMLAYLRRDVEYIQIPDSINFASMGEQDFQRFKKRCMYVLENFLGMDPQLLLEEAGRRSKRHRR